LVPPASTASACDRDEWGTDIQLSIEGSIKQTKNANQFI
jgi:hypothetical protein